MTDVKISALTELTAAASGDMIPIVDISEAAAADKTKYITAHNLGTPVFLTTPLTSTSWDGDARSTTAKTLIDLSAVFSVPAGVRAVIIKIECQDSGAESGVASFRVSPNNLDGKAPLFVQLSYTTANDVPLSSTGICPCDANGDIYYQIAASGAGTLDAWIEIWGYWL